MEQQSLGAKAVEASPVGPPCGPRAWLIGFSTTCGINGTVATFPVPVPGTGRIIATDGLAGAVILENGDVFEFNGTGWTLLGNMLGGGPTATHAESWGKLKARYR